MDLSCDRIERALGKARDVIVANAARGLDQVKTPLYRNAFYLMLAYAVGVAGGLLFWVVAYRFYSSNDTGFAIAMLNTLTFLAGVATLGMPIALIRFLPESDNPTALTNSVLTVSGRIRFVLHPGFYIGPPL